MQIGSGSDWGRMWAALLVGAALATAPSLAPEASAEAGSRLEELRKRAETEEKKRAEWQARYQKRRKAIEDAKARIEVAEENGSWTNRAVTRQEIDQAEADLAEAERKLQDLYDEARRNEVPPGWLRD